MIYFSSNAPTEVKKIQLKTWTFRAHLYSLAKMLEKDKGELPTPDEVKEFIEKYRQESFIVEKGVDFFDEMSAVMLEDLLRAKNPDVGMDPEATLYDLFALTYSLDPRPDIPPEKVATGNVLLSDLNMEEVRFFSKNGYTPGQMIMIEFLVPNNFLLTAEVQTCSIYNINSRIISEIRPSYRVWAKFSPWRIGEKAFLRNFVSSIEPDIPEEKAPPPKPQEDDDDLDDLDDLGL